MSIFCFNILSWAGDFMLNSLSLILSGDSNEEERSRKNH